MSGLEFTGRYDAVQRNFDALGARFIKGPAQARVYNSLAISVANTTGSPTALTFDSERFDTGGFHSTSTNTGRLTAPTAGVYAFGGSVEWPSNATGYRDLWLRVNGTTAVAIDRRNTVIGIEVQASISAVYQLAATDYVELLVQQNSGGALNVNATGDYSPEFWIVRLGSQA